MDIKKLAPWNWFRDEERTGGRNLPVSGEMRGAYPSLLEFHNELDRLFERAWRSFASPFEPAGAAGSGRMIEPGMLRPRLDISSSGDEYMITVEVPGVEEDDIKLELVDRTLTIKGTKRQESSRKDKDFVSVERAFGSFQRVLSLPDDADIEDIEAKFRNGLLNISMPRKASAKPKARGKTIDIRPAA